MFLTGSKGVKTTLITTIQDFPMVLKSTQRAQEGWKLTQKTLFLGNTNQKDKRTDIR
jgi:hypothetical protein